MRPVRPSCPTRSILRFLKLIACDNGKIGTCAKRVDDRNESAHPNGNIFYSTEAALDIKIAEILRVVAEIQTHSKPVIEHGYRDFLLQNHDPDEREHANVLPTLRTSDTIGHSGRGLAPVSRRMERLLQSDICR